MSFVASSFVFLTEFGVLGFFFLDFVFVIMLCFLGFTCWFCLDLRFNLFIPVLIFELCIGLLRIVWFWLECVFIFIFLF